MTQEQPRAGLDFGDAIRALKDGHRVRRAGWNGKGMWLILAASSIAGVREHGPEKFNRIVMLPHIVMKTAHAQYVPWLASQTDMLADDWTDLDAAEQGAAPAAKRYARNDVAKISRGPAPIDVRDPMFDRGVVTARMTDGEEFRASYRCSVHDGRNFRDEMAMAAVLAVANGEAS